MKKKILLAFMFVVALVMFQWNDQNAHSFSGNPPANQTGSGGGSCGNGGCHTGGVVGMGVFGTDLVVDITDGMGNFVPEYTPGETYTVKVIYNATHARYGFAMSTSSSNDNFIAGSTTSVEGSGTGLQVEHSGVNTTGNWQFEWVAPPTDEGDIDFFIGGIGANGDFSNSGDTWYQGTFSKSAAATVAMVDVTFLFNTNCLPGTAPALGTPHVAGDFQGWDPSATPMTDADTDGIWEHTASIEEGTTINFKFLTNAGWGNDESVSDPACGGAGGYGTDRFYTVPTGGGTVGPYAFGSCEDCSIPTPTVSVTFSLDTNCGTFADIPSIAGSMNGWSPTNMTDGDGDGIYTYTVDIEEGMMIQYKYLDGLDFTNAELVPAECGLDDGYGGFNRFLTVPTGVATFDVDVVAFGSCEGCPPPMCTLTLSDAVVECVGTDGYSVSVSFDNGSNGAPGDGGYMITSNGTQQGDNPMTMDSGTIVYAFGAGENYSFSIDGGVGDCSFMVGGDAPDCGPDCATLVAASTISTMSETTMCTDDGSDDIVVVDSDGGMGSNSVILVTDSAGEVILGANTENNEVNLEGAPAGVCLIWELYYEGDLPEIEAGTTLVADALGMIDCSELSNSIAVTRLTGDDCPSTCDAVASTISTESETTVCVGDGEADEIVVMSEGGMGSNSAIIISDGAGEVILGVITDGSNPNFDGAPAGTCLIWELYYEGDLPEVEAGVTLVADALAMIDCSALSNSIEVIREDCTPVGPFANAGTVTPPVDVEIDDMECIVESPTVEGAYDGEGYSYAFVLTTDLDPEDNFMFDIIDINSSGSFDLCSYDLPFGTVFNVHGLSFEGDLDGLLGLVELGGIATGEQAAGAIDAGLIDADLIIPGYQVTYIQNTICNNFTAEYTVLDCSDEDVTNDTYSITINWEGGEAPYTLEGTTIDEEEVTDDTSLTVTGLDDDAVYVILDANGCQTIVDVNKHFCTTIDVCDSFTASYMKLDCTEEDNNAGTFGVTISWEGGEAPYTINDDETTDETSLTLLGITDGSEVNYLITDANGCQAVVMIDEQPCAKCTLGASYEKLDCTEAQQDAGEFSILVTITDGTAPYSVESSIFTDDVDSVFEISNIADGTAFDLEVSDADGCTFTLAIAGETCAKDNCTFPIDADVLECTENQQTSGAYSVMFTWGGNGPFTLEGVFNEEDYDGNSVTVDDLPDGSDYTLAVTDADGCTAVVSGSGSCAKCQIELLEINEVYIENDDCVEVTISIDNGTAPYDITYSYDDVVFEEESYDSDTFTFCGTLGADYTMMVTDNVGCTATIEGRLATELVSFEGVNNENGNLITFTTGSEEDTDKFFVERSTDGINFEVIATLSAAGNSTTLLHYSYNDTDIEACMVYFYRLVEVTTDGVKTLISNVVRLSVEGTCTELIVMPIPAINELTVEFNGTAAVTVLTIYDVVGRVISQQNIDTTVGFNQTGVDISSYATGTYYLTISSGDNVETAKFVKQ